MVRKKGSEASAETDDDPPDPEMRDQEMQTDRSMDSFESTSSTTTVIDAFASRSVGIQADLFPLSFSSHSASTSITSPDFAQRPSEHRMVIEEDDISDTDLDTTQPEEKCRLFMSVWKLIRWYVLSAVLYGTICYIFQYYSVKHPGDDAT